jgi:Flp pilus assembly protein TadD
LFYRKQPQEALAEITQAHNLDPLSPVINFALGSQLFYARRYKESADQWHQTIPLAPENEMSYYGAGLADEQLRQNGIAEQEFRHALVLAPNDPDAISALAHVYAMARDQNSAQHLLAKISTLKPAPGYDIALVKEALGEHGQALQWLQFAERHHDENLMEISLDPRMAALRRHVGERKDWG